MLLAKTKRRMDLNPKGERSFWCHGAVAVTEVFCRFSVLAEGNCARWLFAENLFLC